MAKCRTVTKVLGSNRRYHIVKRFASALYQRGEIDVYWLPYAMKIICRKATPGAYRFSEPIPAEAAYFGRFRRPHSPAQFVTDLDDWLWEQSDRSWVDPR